MKEIELENLDDSFFEDLREGNFILVLGAGFSFRVPNKAGGTIPIGDEFKEITKKRFNDNTSTDYQSAAQVWRTEIRKDGKLLNEFKNLFLIDETKFDKKLYSSIFIPEWYNIYTLNFDNVLDIALKEFSKRNFLKFSYPKSTGGSYKPDIFHLHGEIENISDIDSELIFTPESYAKFDTEVPHDLYDVLHSDVKTLHKKILVLGSQFKEPVILKKFFKTLPEDKSVKIYHFDIENYNLHSDNFAKRDTTFVKLDKAKEGTKHFLQFLLDHQDEVENIHIEGAEIINSAFVKKIKEGESFTPAEFYTAKQDDSCQWYGVMHDYDVVRKDYEKLRNIALKCFDKPYFKKVAAVIHGFGGCGKSTLLRRLAVELKDSPFKIVWLKDREFDNLADYGLKQIKQDTSRNFLLIIEDWYRITANGKTKEFFLNAQTIPNLRIIIGDREINGKDYINNLYEITNQFHLQPEENEKIINDILDKFKDWKPASEKVLKNNAAKTTSLFLLLFVIARINEEQFGDTEIDFTDPSSAFRDIIKSDLNNIYIKYPGLAKALYNWACIYTNYKIFIDFNSFLKVADYFNGNTDVSSDFSNLNGHFPEMHRLKNFININKKTDLKNKKLHSIDFVQFNHDKLAEEGLAYAVIEGWDVFYNQIIKKYENDNLLKEFTKVVIEHCDDCSSSVFVSTMLRFQKQSFNASQKLGFINQLYTKGNIHVHYLEHLSDDDIGLSPPEIKKYLYELFDRQVYPYIVWLSYFKKADSQAQYDAAIKILEDGNNTSIIGNIVFAAFNQQGYDEKSKQEIEKAKHDAAIKILAFPDIILLQPDKVVAAFNQKGFDEKSKQEIEKAKHDAAIKILAAPDITLLIHHIVIASFNQKGYDEKSKQEIEKAKHESATKILEDGNITSIDGNIVVTAFNQKGYDEKSKQEIEKAKYEAAIKILEDGNITSIDGNIVIAAFNQKGYDEKSKQEIEKAKYEAAIKILEDGKNTSIDGNIVIAAFNQKDYDEKSKQKIEKAKYEVAIKILENGNIALINSNIVIAAFNQKGYDEKSKQKIEKAKYEAATKILEDANWNEQKNLFPVLLALRFYSALDKPSEIVNKRIHEIINSFLQNPKLKLNRFFYFGLMRIPFHNIKLWKDHCEFIIVNWQSKDRRGITSVLHSNKELQEKIKDVCNLILKKWRKEIIINIFQVYGKPHRGDHIKFALGHPDLREIAMITAKEMAAEEEKNPNTLPDYLLEIILKIVQEKPEFPEWNKNTENESNTQLSE